MKTILSAMLATAAVIAAACLETSSARAYGDAPWCAVKSLGKGDVYWDCQYRTFAACYPNALADRGFCNVNPWPGPSQAVPYKRRHAQY
jgi:uncharacterized protein DUF3551